MIFSDETYFYLTESLNKQNNLLWLKERPVDWIERPLQDEKVLVWCAISAKKIYGPFFFECTVNQHTYLDMLKIFFLAKAAQNHRLLFSARWRNCTYRYIGSKLA